MRPTPTNSLILLLPTNYFEPILLQLFQAHFTESYGELESWTSLEKLGRILIVYKEIQSAILARTEMDGFIWEEDQQDSILENDQNDLEMMRAFFGPLITLPQISLKATLLAVPELSRNFLISPPGSPPIGWEQVLEEKPHNSTDPGGEDWAGELERALRYLSVDTEQQEDNVVNSLDQVVEQGKTHTILASDESNELVRPIVTVSTPSTLPLSLFSTPPIGATKITSVKATIESMLGRRKSFSNLPKMDRFELNVEGLGTTGGGMKIIPTARPPTESIAEYL